MKKPNVLDLNLVVVRVSAPMMTKGRVGPLLSLCMHLFIEYVRTATTEADGKRNIHENIF